MIHHGGNGVYGQAREGRRDCARTGCRALLVAALLAGCAAAPPAGPSAGLLETHWRAVEIGGEPVAGGDGRRRAHLILRAGGRANGYAGCNSLAGSYRLDGTALRFGPLAMTRMTCLSDELNRAEAAFTKALGDTASYRIDGDVLELRDEAVVTRMRFRAGEAP